MKRGLVVLDPAEIPDSERTDRLTKLQTAMAADGIDATSLMVTGGALDANEGEPGPFYIQGDHTGGLKFRNITVSVPER